MNDIINWMKSIGFKEINDCMKLTITIPKITTTIYCNIYKDDLDVFIDSDTKDYTYTKQYVIQCINETKINAIKKYMEGQIVNDENMNTLRTFIEALGYEKKDNSIWKLKFEYKMPSKTYEDSAILDEEDLKNMTLNDAMLRAMDTKRSKETELEFKMKYDTESVDSFVEQFDCPTCPK